MEVVLCGGFGEVGTLVWAPGSLAGYRPCVTLGTADASEGVCLKEDGSDLRAPVRYTTHPQFSSLGILQRESHEPLLVTMECELLSTPLSTSMCLRTSLAMMFHQTY